jgi:hypothetical protein
VESVVSHENAAKYAVVIRKVPNSHQKNDTQKIDKRVFLDIFFNLSLK